MCDDNVFSSIVSDPYMQIKMCETGGDDNQLQTQQKMVTNARNAAN